MAEIARFYKKSNICISSAEEKEIKAEEPLTSKRLRRCVKCGKQCKLCRKVKPPEGSSSVRMINLFNNAMSHFCKILKRRQKQVSLDKFLVKSALKEQASIEPIDRSDSLSDSESCPTQ